MCIKSCIIFQMNIPHFSFILVINVSTKRFNWQTKKNVLEVVSSNPHCGDHCLCTIHLGQSMELNMLKALTYCYWCSVILHMRGWILRNGWIINYGLEFNERLSADWDQIYFWEVQIWHPTGKQIIERDFIFKINT